MIRAGVDPGLLDEVSRWRTDDLWFSALEALVTYMRAAVARGGETVRLSADGSPAATMSGSQPRPDLDAQIAHPRPHRTRGEQVDYHAEPAIGSPSPGGRHAPNR
jgi:hypothetical protein